MKVFIGLPALRSLLCAEQQTTWFSLGNEIAQSGLFTGARIEHLDFPNIDFARNVITKKAMDWGANWLLMMDSDNWVSSGSLPDSVGTPGKHIVDMLVTGNELRAAMIAAPVLGRRPHNYDRLNMHHLVDGRWIPYQTKEVLGKVQEVDYIGMGLVGVSLDWLRLKWPEGPWYTTQYQEGVLKQQGEDYGFCAGVHERNGKVICDGRFLPGHKTLCD